MPYGSGLSAQFGAKTETTVGTPVTVDTFFEFLSEAFVFAPTWMEGAGLKAGQAFKRAARAIQTKIDVNGDVVVEHTDRGHMGLLWRHALGSATTVPTQIASTTAYKQIHTPGPRTGLSLTAQVGRPQTDGTVRPHTYAGCKVTGWEFSCNDGQLPHLKLTFDGQQESTATALAAATFSGSAVPFNYTQSTIKLGGTASTTAGETSIATGVAAASLIKGITITAALPMRTDGYGNSTTKREQIENGIPTITLALDTEYTSRTELYDVFKANTTIPLEWTFSYGDAGGANPFLLSFIVPALKLKTANPAVAGPDIVGQPVTAEVYDDGSGTNPPFQVKLVSTDTTI